MKTIHDVEPLRAALQSWHQDRESIALVPTMGNLHKGHMSLIKLAQEYAERVVVSIFVNPTQFGPDEDFDDYPRTLANDRRRLSRAGVDLVFAPDVVDIYPQGQNESTGVVVPVLSDMLCGSDRPGHFAGVTSVVARLLNIVQPEVAVFGQKDYQQLTILRRMVDDLFMPVKIIAGQTYREPSGLAMSSRNQYLSDAEREVAPGLYRALRACRERLLAGEPDYAKLEKAGLEELTSLGFHPDYFAIRAARDLDIPADDNANLVVLAAARLGKARLIDNVLVARSG